MDKEHVFFENYAKNWDRDRKADDRVLSSFMELAAIRPGSAILDAGCGTGVLLPYLSAAAGDEGSVEGFDYSQQMIDVAKDKFSHLANVTFTTGNVLKYAFPRKHYDVVCCLNFYPHIAEHSRDVIRRLYEALVPGGMLLIMHDLPRQAVNAIHGGAPVLPPVDILEEKLISAGFPSSWPWIRTGSISSRSSRPPTKPISSMTMKKNSLLRHTPVPIMTITIRKRNASSTGCRALRATSKHQAHDRRRPRLQRRPGPAGGRPLGHCRREPGHPQGHIDHCIVDAIHEGDAEAVENLKKAINTFVK